MGIKLPIFEPRGALERGAGGAFGLRNAEFEPAKPSGRGCGLRNARFEPGGALERGAEGVIGLRNAKIDPARPSGRALRAQEYEI